MAYDPNIIGDTGVVHDALLSWKAGAGAVSHIVYLDPNFDDVNAATSPADDCYVGTYAVDHNYVDDAFLEFGSTIYWRVDEVGASTTSRGNIWRFSTDNGRARNALPGSGATDVNVIDLELVWDRAPGRVPYPVRYNVYFSDSYDEVNDVAVDNTAVGWCIASNRDVNNIARSVVKLDTTYWWRVDTKAINDPCTVRGNVWSCTTANNYDVENFESYSNNPEMYSYWEDTGSVENFYWLNFGYPYSGFKCVSINYYTYFSPYYGGVKRTHVSPTQPWNSKVPTWADWTFGGTADALSLWFGPGADPNLAMGGIDELYAKLTDSSSREAVIQYSDNWPVSNFDNGGHQEWNIDLQEFVDANPSIDLTNVKSFEFGFLDGLGTAPAQKGMGYIFFDQLRLYARRCISRYGLPNADLNDDCLVNGDDLSMMAGDWLLFDYSMDARAVDPCDANLVAHWKLDEDMYSDRAVDYTGKHHATIMGNPTWDPNGRIDGAIEIVDNGSDDYLDAGGGKEPGDDDTWADITGDITVTAWVRPEFTTWWQQLNSVINKGREEGWELHKSVTNVPRLFEYNRTISFYVKLQGEECPWHGIHALTDMWDQKWHHVAGVYKIYQPRISPDQPGMSEILVYTDGVKEASYACGGTPINSCDWPVGIGSNIETLTRTQWRSHFYGHLDDVRVYNRALDHDEIVGIVKEGTVGPLGHWTFDDGTANDVSGNDNHGSFVSGASVVWDDDRDSNVLDVGDANGYVDCGGGHALNDPNCTENPDYCTWADILGEFSVMAWVKPSMTDRVPYCGTVVSKGDWNGGYDTLGDPNGRNREGWSMIRRAGNNEVSVSIVGSANTASYFTPTEGIVLDMIDVNVWDGKWHHIAAVYDNLNWIDVYVDGLHAAHQWAKSFDDPQTIGTNNYHIFIGASSGEIQGAGPTYADFDTGWKGRIDDVRVYDRALTQIEIASAMAGADLYVPLDSLANLYDVEGMNSKVINFKDYQLLATEWLEDTKFPFVP